MRSGVESGEIWWKGRIGVRADGTGIVIRNCGVETARFDFGSLELERSQYGHACMVESEYPAKPLEPVLEPLIGTHASCWVRAY
jgi:hypothetical protein